MAVKAHAIPRIGVPWMPLKDMARNVAALWLMMSFTLSSVYRSNLKAMIIFPRIHLPFSSLDELADSNIDSILVNGSAIHTHIMVVPEWFCDCLRGNVIGTLLSKSPGMFYKPLPGVLFVSHHYKMATWSSPGHPEHPPDHPPNQAADTEWETMFLQTILKWDEQQESHYNILTAEKYGSLLQELTNIRSLPQSGRCNYYTLSRGFLGPLSLSLAFPKGSPLRRKFNQIITRLRESGIMMKLFTNGMVNSTQCISHTGSYYLFAAKERPLQLKDFYGVFLVYTIGQFLGLCLFFVELGRSGQRLHT
ncbi:uncharacterized protein LOC123502971 [Portunus trituberculatus]|uniref:uncharacterized protein LOC123502971 n=1 Tax=Portunus trituberculatus TaxID=210409 RepID=UPI001E1CF1E8|nr:uncharacterized protein LOC123502971 [Portunus trituberculatus]